MCGIVGVVSPHASHRADDILHRMMKMIKHRGPDDEGIFSSGSIAIGFVRLAVIDPPGGHQPMHSHDGRYVLVFNGEIYNFRELRNELQHQFDCHFTTDCDSEVVLQSFVQWGTSCFARFNGMFAIGIWDHQEKRLFLARDRSGKKPMYVYQSGETLLFSSEVKSFLTHPVFNKQVCASRLAASLAYRYVPEHETPFQGVQAVQPAHWLEIHASDQKTNQHQHSYWQNPAKAAEFAHEPVSALIEKLNKHLVLAVERRMVADVPLGAFLSGGLDSSLIVAIMAKLSPNPVQTFSIGFDTGHSEHIRARSVAQHFHTSHRETIIRAEDLLKEIPAVLWYRETPISEPSDIPLFILSREARRHVTVVLSGEGSDEIFAGYPKYVAEYYANQFGIGTARHAARGMNTLTSKTGSASRAGIATAAFTEADQFDRMARWFGAFGNSERQALMEPALLEHMENTHRFAEQMQHAHPGTHLTQLQLQDFAHWLPANLLLRGDRVTMANSLELRCPFLDPDLVNFAFRKIPDKYKIRYGTSKWILRQLGRKLLPVEVASQKKWGFKVPVSSWFRGALKPVLQEVLFSDAATGRGYFNRNEVNRLYTEHTDHGADHGKQLWFLFQLELWHLMFIDGTLQPTDDLTMV